MDHENRTDQPNRTEHTIRTETVQASPLECYEVAIDLEKYSEWIDAVSSAVIDTADKLGRPETASFVAQGMGRTTRYQLRYDLSDAPASIRWSLVSGDIMETLDGAYSFSDSRDVAGSTDVTYELTVDPTIPIPGFVKRRAEGKLISSALPKFKARVESLND